MGVACVGERGFLFRVKLRRGGEMRISNERLIVFNISEDAGTKPKVYLLVSFERYETNIQNTTADLY